MWKRALVTTALGAGMIASLPTAAQAQRPSVRSGPTLVFRALDDHADPTFNQLLGINNHGVIAGYFGSGNPATTHPNKGYTVHSPYRQRDYVDENFPGSQQTQVTAINNVRKTVGFWVDQSGVNMGFVAYRGVFRSVSNPLSTASPRFDQLLGVNDHDLAVGFYNDAAGNSHAYQYNTRTGRFTAIAPPGAVSAQATGINNNNAVAGFMVDAHGNTTAWRLHHGTFMTLAVPGATQTQAFGINNEEKIVGQYVDAANNTHGFVYSRGSFRTIDDPNGVGATTVNGLNDEGALVGFYTDAAGNTNGMLAVLREPHR